MSMGVRDFQELVAWQLSYELKCEVFALLRRLRRRGISNTAIRFASLRHPRRPIPPRASGDSAHGSSRASLKSRVYRSSRPGIIWIDGRDRGYLDVPLYSRLCNLARATLKTTTNLML